MNKIEALNICIDEYFPNLTGKFKKELLLQVIGKEKYSLVELGYSHSSGSSRACKAQFPNKPKNIKLCTYILSLNNWKYCYSCKQVKNIKLFNKDECKECCSVYQKKYQQEHKEEQRYRSSLRRAREQQAIPPWANLNKIKEIYRNCPKGFHVDHIYPLVNNISCGLHVENNLQHLPALDNLKKFTKLPESVK